MGLLRSDGGRSWGTRDTLLHQRITIVARVRTYGPFTLLLTQADDPPWVAADELRLLVAEDLAVVRIVFNEEDDESGEDEGKVACAEEGYEVLESRKEGRWRGEVRHDNGRRE